MSTAPSPEVIARAFGAQPGDISETIGFSIRQVTLGWLPLYTGTVHFRPLSSSLRIAPAVRSVRRDDGGRNLLGPPRARPGLSTERALRLRACYSAALPSRHKIALVVVVVITAVSMVLVPLVAHSRRQCTPLRRSHDRCGRASRLLTYLIMPRVTRLFAFWLFPPAQPKGAPCPPRLDGLRPQPESTDRSPTVLAEHLVCLARRLPKQIPRPTSGVERQGAAG